MNIAARFERGNSRRSLVVAAREPRSSVPSNDRRRACRSASTTPRTSSRIASVGCDEARIDVCQTAHALEACAKKRAPPPTNGSTWRMRSTPRGSNGRSWESNRPLPPTHFTNGAASLGCRSIRAATAADVVICRIARLHQTRNPEKSGANPLHACRGREPDR